MFPHYKQLDIMDCGPTCLKIIAAYYGKYFSLQMLRDKCHITREGVSLLGISDAAELIGLRSTGVKITWDQMRDEMPLPCIVHWNQQHFVVVYKVKKNIIYISDPAIGLLKYSVDQFKKSWLQSNDHEACKGIALILEPTPDFYKAPGNIQSSIPFIEFLHYIMPYKKYVIQLLIAVCLASLLSLILPFLTQSVVDIGIGSGDLSFVVMMLIAQFVLVVGQMANNLIRSWIMLHVTTRISISLISNFLSKLMRLPISFFDSKLLGDIMQRIDDYDRIQSFLTGSLLSIFMAIITFMVYGVVMGGYNILILGIFLSGSLIYILWIFLFMARRRKLDYVRFQESATNQSNVVQLINGMQDIKLNNCEKQKRWEWENIQAKLYQISIQGLTLGQTQEIGGIFIDQTKNVIISFLAARAVIEGELTLGMMMALQYIIGQLNAPLSQFIQFIHNTQDAKLSIDRLREFYEKEDEESFDNTLLKKIPDNISIEFKNVSFQYRGPHSKKAIEDINFIVPYNKVTAIVGASGSGKTTILKMMLGFYNPMQGEILLGGKKLSQYSPSVWRSLCGSVMQEGFIFSDTIANNIGISDQDIDMDKVIMASRIANLEEYINTLPLGFNTIIGAEGNGLSTGQKQRLLIARAAYKDAKFLFFDEATNSLDANNERTIMERLDKLFVNKTVVVVAHRLSTVKNADNIIVLSDGKIVEQGVHKSLIDKKGYYYELVKNQLELGS